MNDDNRTSSRFFVSYDHEIRADVLTLCGLLRAEHLTVRVDEDDDGERQYWPDWMLEEIELADRVLVVVSPGYREHFSRKAPPGEGRGVDFEAKIIKEEMAADLDGSLRKFVPVLLPGIGVDAIPKLLWPRTATHWRVPALTPEGVADLVGLLRQPLGRPSPTAADTAEREGRTGALWLAVTSGPPAAVSEVVTAFAAGAETTAVTRFGAGDGGIGLRTGAPQEVVAHLLRITRLLSGILGRHRGNGGTPVVTLGAHVDRGPAAAAAGAQWAAAAPAARRLHAAPRVGMVVAVSPAFHAQMADLPVAARAAYREFLRGGEDGEPVHLSAPGLSRCPELPPDSAPDSVAPHAPAGPTIIGDRGRININSVDNSVDNSDNFHIAVGRDVIVRRERE
jgi:hypothetical protein